IMFGIDIRLAGVLTAALLVAIIAPTLFFRQEPARTAAPRKAISAYVVQGEAEKEIARSQAPAAAPKNAVPAPEAKAREAPTDELARGGAPAQTRADSATLVHAESPALQKPQAAAEAQAPPTLAKRDAAVAERAGGDSGALAVEESDAEKIHLAIEALDGGGQPPTVAAAPSDQRLAPFRGRQFIVVVEASGRVRDASPSKTQGLVARRQKDAAAKAEESADPARDLLLELRFQPEGRPRRLLVRIQ
ncbi:MAG: hypothetical protein ABI968_14595, partial [Acidobacteriota bacterium]